MPFPSERTGVPRNRVGRIVGAMLRNDEVGNVTCKLDANGTYTVTPHRR